MAAYAERWLNGRTTETVKDDRSRVYTHITPAIGPLLLSELGPRIVREFVVSLSKKKKLGNRRVDGTRTPNDALIAPRTVRHVYGTLRAMLNDAVADELIASNPCVLKKHELPEKKDKDRTWRRTAVFTREEVETIISASDENIPEDRRTMYAMLFLGAMRFGEAAALDVARLRSERHAAGQAGGRDTRRTFISIARADGARPDILRWATHGPTGDIVDAYTTLPWPTLCDEVSRVRIVRNEGKLIQLLLVVGSGPNWTLFPQNTPESTVAEALVISGVKSRSGRDSNPRPPA